MDDYLSKPINEQALLTLLNKYCPQDDGPQLPKLAETPNKDATETSTASVTEAVLPVLDPKLGIESSFGDRAVWHTMLEMMLEQLPSYVNKLNQASDDMVQLKQISHKLAGTCSYCGAPALDQAAKQLEASCQSGEIARVRDALPKLQQQIERMRRLDEDGKLRGSSEPVY